MKFGEKLKKMRHRAAMTQAEELVAELSGLFAGGELSERDKDAVMIALQKAYFDCKEDNRKYGRRRRGRKVEDDD